MGVWELQVRVFNEDRPHPLCSSQWKRIVCGSHLVAAAVKDALGFSISGPSAIMKGGPSITLHTEAFGYA